MKTAFQTFLQLGFDHISDWDAYDHMLFVVALCAVYQLAEWRKVLILITAFTIGHSLTLVLAALRVINPPSAIIEFLIPLTIFMTAAFNFFQNEERRIRWKYLFALVFGLIHGMGFSGYFRSLLGREADIVLPLFAFNVGIELGQLVIVLVILLLSIFAFQILKVKARWWNGVISGVAALVSLKMMIENWPW